MAAAAAPLERIARTTLQLLAGSLMINSIKQSTIDNLSQAGQSSLAGSLGSKFTNIATQQIKTNDHPLSRQRIF